MGRRCFSTAKWSGYALSPSQRMLGLAPRSSSSLTAASLLPKTAWCSVYLLKGVITIGRTRMPQESSAIHVARFSHGDFAPAKDTFTSRELRVRRTLGLQMNQYQGKGPNPNHGGTSAFEGLSRLSSKTANRHSL